MMKSVKTSQLQPHPQNNLIYGEKEDVTELQQSIEKNGLIKPIVVTQDNIILSGHSRWKAVKNLGWQTVECNVVQVANDTDALRRLLIENQYRQKDNLQKAREYQMWIEIEKAEALVRQKEAGSHGRKGAEHGKKGGRGKLNPLQENFPEGGLAKSQEENKSKPNKQSRDKAADKINMSGRSASDLDQALKVADAINEYAPKKALLMYEAIRHSASGSRKLAKHIDSMSEEECQEYKHQLESKKISIPRLIEKHQRRLAKKKYEENLSESQKQHLQESEINNPHVSAYDENMFLKSLNYNDGRFDDHIIENNDKLPTLTTHGRFFHADGLREYSLREYARVQTFPENYRFVGTYQTIKKQIGNAVAPDMAQFVTEKLGLTTGKTIGDLFAGCGGFSCGAHYNGMITKWAVEWEELPAMAYKMNFPECKVIQTNISALNPADFEKVDVILGGPPCQGFSVAGPQFKDDPRNELYKEFLRFVDYLKPQQFIMENVPQIAVMKETIIKDFSGIGYTVETMLVHGNDIGMAQNRKRFFFIGNR